MLTLAHPVWLALLPIVLGATWFLRDREAAAGQMSAAVTLVNPTLAVLPAGHEAAPSTRRLTLVLTMGALTLMVLALAQPQWLGALTQEAPLGRDIVLLLDTSDSMSIDDFELDGKRISRLDILRALTRQFVAVREGDRFGLIAFGDFAATLAPPTFDRDFVSQHLARLRVGAAGEATAIGDAIALALKQVRGEKRLRPVLILFSDGDNTAGEMRLSEAMALARSMNVAIYGVNIGTDLFGAGRPAAPANKTAEPGMKTLAEQTGGKYYIAGTSDALKAVIADIGKLEPTIARPPTRRAVDEWYWLPLAIAALCLTLARIVRLRKNTP